MVVMGKLGPAIDVPYCICASVATACHVPNVQGTLYKLVETTSDKNPSGRRAWWLLYGGYYMIKQLKHARYTVPNYHPVDDRSLSRSW